MQKTTNGLAIASMVLGIVWVYWIGSILALIFGYIAKGQISGSAGRAGGPAGWRSRASCWLGGSALPASCAGPHR